MQTEKLHWKQTHKKSFSGSDQGFISLSSPFPMAIGSYCRGKLHTGKYVIVPLTLSQLSDVFSSGSSWATCGLYLVSKFRWIAIAWTSVAFRWLHTVSAFTHCFGKDFHSSDTHYEHFFLLPAFNMISATVFIPSRGPDRSCTILILSSNVCNSSIHSLQIRLSPWCQGVLSELVLLSQGCSHSQKCFNPSACSNKFVTFIL